MTTATTATTIGVYPPPQVTFVEGSGAQLVDDHGRTYIDMCAGIAVASLGHGHPELAEAVAEQARRLMHVSNLFGTEPQRALAARLAELSGGMASFFCNSGAEAVECALKIVRRWGHTHGRRRVVAAQGSFHGRTLGALGITGQPAKRSTFGPFGEVTFVPFGDEHALSAALADEDVAGVFIEPIQGEGGVIPAPPRYLTAARALCDESGALLVLDEVQTGVGRTGHWFAWQHEDARPDVMCLAKGLGGGLPTGACLAAPTAAAVLGVGSHGSTFGGGPVQSAAALTVLDVIERDGLLQRAHDLGRRAAGRLDGLGAQVRGSGLLLGIDLGAPLAAGVAAALLQRGVVVSTATDRVVRITPPLTIDDASFDHALTTIEEVIGEIATT